jgi:hypothetical protein
MKETEVTPEGWVITDPSLFRLMADHDPPRQVFWPQLCADARGWRTWALWLAGGGLLAAGAAAGEWGGVVAGAGVLTFWLVGFVSTVRCLRGRPLASGVVGSLGPHPLPCFGHTARARLGDGRVAPVALEPELGAAIADALAGGRTAEVLFLDNPGAEYSMFIGVRVADTRAPAPAEGPKS